MEAGVVLGLEAGKGRFEPLGTYQHADAQRSVDPATLEQEREADQAAGPSDAIINWSDNDLASYSLPIIFMPFDTQLYPPNESS